MGNALSGFGRPGRWFKGNLHTHTNLFDGLASPLEVATMYREAGYQFLAITDHNMFNAYPELSTEEFLMLPGVELTPGAEIEKLIELASNGGIAELMRSMFESPSGPPRRPKGLSGAAAPSEIRLDHVVAISRSASVESKRFDGGKLGGIADMVEIARAHDCVAIIAHPYWSGLGMEELLKISGAVGIEVYNHVCAPREDSTIYWDSMLNRGASAFPIACDDMHHPKRAFGGFLMVKAEELSHGALIEAIERGEFYASSGPEIHELTLGDGELTLRCSPVTQVRILSNLGTSVSRGIYEAGGSEEITECRHSLGGGEEFIRVEVCDRMGRKAWTNPTWLKAE